MIIREDEVLADIGSAAWMEQELHPGIDRHRRHQMADICQRDNVERVWRVFGVTVAEIRFALITILKPPGDLLPANELQRPECWSFTFLVRLAPDTLSFLKEKIHECLVAAVMADRTAVIIPEASAVWRMRAAEALVALREAAASSACRPRPVRRPLWPF